MLDFDNLDKMIAEKVISVQKHPTLDLYIYNYTQKAQFDRIWNNETLQCRGLIMDGNRNIVSRPFRKFFNMGELDVEFIDAKGDFTVTEKMDGSLGISYFDPDGKMYIATRGSFVSDQAKKANELLAFRHDQNAWNSKFTYLFEIIYPENRIVVDYKGQEDLILLSIVNTKTGEELQYEDIVIEAIYQGVSVVPRFDGITDFTKIEQKPNSEGYVVHFPTTGLRFKVKFDEYVRLHKILTGINAKRIWEILAANGSLDDILDRVPDEFFKWVSDTEISLKTKFFDINMEAKALHYKIKDLPTRKEQAIAIKDSPLRGIVFNMLDGKPYDQIIWKMIEPKYETPFKVE